MTDLTTELAQLRESVRLCEQILDAQERAGTDVHESLAVAGQLDSFRRRLHAAETGAQAPSREEKAQAFARFVEGELHGAFLDELI